MTTPRPSPSCSAFNEAHPELEGPWDSAVFEDAEATNGRDAECADLRASVTPPIQAAIDQVMADNDLDAIIALTNGPAWITNFDQEGGDFAATDGFANFVGSSTAAAASGYADITVPAGFHGPLPIGITFIGGAWDEPQLIGFAFDFEQATQVRVPPDFIPTIGDDALELARPSGNPLRTRRSRRRSSPAEAAPGGCRRCGSSGRIPQDTGIRFSGSTNGIGTTFAARFPHSVSTVSLLPGSAIAVGTQQ